jgi:hypothetical protein
MSFKARELMIDVLPAARPCRIPGFALCAEATRREEDDAKECSEATRAPDSVYRGGAADLAVLRGQLRQAVSVERSAAN